MKKLFFLLSILIYSNLHSQVGISNNLSFTPTSMLDVDGSVKIRNVLNLPTKAPASGNRFLIIGNSGDIDTTQLNISNLLTANNGLTLASSIIRLGGMLNQNTTIEQNTFNFNFNGSGSIGIGNTSPTHKLHVSGGIRAESGFIANDGTATTPAFRFNSQGTLGMYRIGSNILGFATNSIERVRIDASGNIGINTTSPSEMVEATNGNIKLTTTTPASSTQGQLHFTAGGIATTTKMVVSRRTISITTANTTPTIIFNDNYMRFAVWFTGARWVIGFSPITTAWFDYNYIGNSRYYNGTYYYTSDGLNNYIWGLSDDVNATAGTFYELGGVLNTAGFNYASGGSGTLYAEGTSTINPFYEFSFFVSYTSTSTQRLITTVIKSYY